MGCLPFSLQIIPLSLCPDFHYFPPQVPNSPLSFSEGYFCLSASRFCFFLQVSRSFLFKITPFKLSLSLQVPALYLHILSSSFPFLSLYIPFFPLSFPSLFLQTLFLTGALPLFGWVLFLSMQILFFSLFRFFLFHYSRFCFFSLNSPPPSLILAPDSLSLHSLSLDSLCVSRLSLSRISPFL